MVFGQQIILCFILTKLKHWCILKFHIFGVLLVYSHYRIIGCKGTKKKEYMQDFERNFIECKDRALFRWKRALSAYGMRSYM